MVLSLTALGTINIINIQREFTEFASRKDRTYIKSPETVYTFSKNGKNVLIIMLDRAISTFVPLIFNERKELSEKYSGFTYFPNCVSFGSVTVYGMPPIFGGYEYTPLMRQRNNTVPLVEEQNQALLLLPRMFSEKDYVVTVTDPTYANLSQHEPDIRIFNEYSKIKADNIIGKYSDFWMVNHQELKTISIKTVLKNKLLHFSFFKFAPLFLRPIIYDKGKWLGDTMNDRVPSETLDNYVALDILPQISRITEDSSNTYNAIVNELTHKPTFLKLPDYLPSSEVSTKMEYGSQEAHYHVNAASFIVLGKFFDFLRENEIYDNTRIILVSDHGWGLDLPESPFLPDGKRLSEYNPILLVKDFDTHDDFKTDFTFMTNADVPLLGLQNLIENPVNPFTNKALKSDKATGVFVTTEGNFNFKKHDKFTFDISKAKWLYVHDNIFDTANWTTVDN